jgi:hypothetical protein
MVGAIERVGRASAGPIRPDPQQTGGFSDDFVKNPISALRFISRSLRRTESTPRASRFARLELGLFTSPSSFSLSAKILPGNRRAVKGKIVYYYVFTVGYVILQHLTALDST